MNCKFSWENTSSIQRFSSYRWDCQARSSPKHLLIKIEIRFLSLFFRFSKKRAALIGRRLARLFIFSRMILEEHSFFQTQFSEKRQKRKVSNFQIWCKIVWIFRNWALFSISRKRSCLKLLFSHLSLIFQTFFHYYYSIVRYISFLTLNSFLIHLSII